MTPPVTALVTSTSPHTMLAARPLLSHCRRMSALPLPSASVTGRLMLTRFLPKTTSGLPGLRTPCTWWIFTSRTYLPTVLFATSILTRTSPSLWTFRFLRVRVISLNSPVTTCSRMERVKEVGIPIITPPRGALARLFSPLATITSVSRFCRASRRSSSAWSSASVGGGGRRGGPHPQVDDDAGGEATTRATHDRDALHGAAAVARGRAAPPAATGPLSPAAGPTAAG